ncbi:MAG TPA: hypothetical protein VF641_10240 [Methylobacterium sp.]
MSISPFTAGTYRTDRNTANLVALKSQLDTLSTQLATGRSTDSYGGLGANRTKSLSAHATLSALDGYDAAITGARTRVEVTTASVTQVASLADELRRNLTAASSAALSNTTQLARNGLDAALDALSQEVGGRYLFGGRATDAPPVASSDHILNGDASAGLDGLKTLIREQKTADLGPNRNGRVTATSTATPPEVLLSEDGTGAAGTETRANFGFKLLSVVSSNPSSLATAPSVAATQPNATFDLAAPPQAGDRVRVTIKATNGTQSVVELTAQANPPAGSTTTIPVFANAADAETYLNGRFAGSAATGVEVVPSRPDVTFTLASPPKEGDRIRVAVNGPDGRQTFVDLTAKANAPAGSTDTIPVFGTAGEAATYLNGRFAGVAVASIQGEAALGLQADFGTGTPNRVGISVKAPPAIGDTITVNVGLKDGTTHAITLTAKAQADAGSNESFSVTGDVAANIANAVSNALKNAAASTLSASSTVRATQDFFAGSQSAGFAPRRVSADGNGYAEQASTKTVIWYTGDDTSPDPRATATVGVGANRKLSVGAQANEAPIRAALAGIAALAAETFIDPKVGSVEEARYRAVAERSRTLLVPNGGEASLEGIASTLSLAAKGMQDAKDQNRTTRASLEDALDGIDTVDTNEVAAKLLALQTQLEASYQVTSTLSKLSLVNYL